jgi:hypothetical protein
LPIFSPLCVRVPAAGKHVENISNEGAQTRTAERFWVGLGVSDGASWCAYRFSGKAIPERDGAILLYAKDTLPRSPRRAAWPEGGLCQGSRPLRGAQDAALTQALLPAYFSAMWGMCRCGPRRGFNVQDPDRCRRGHGRGRHGESFPAPVHAPERMSVAPRSAVQLAGSRRSRGQHRALFPHCARIDVSGPAQSRTAASWIHRWIHEVARGRW